MARFYHAFKWQTVVEVIKTKTKGIVLIASPGDDEEKILDKLTPEEKARIECIPPIYGDDGTVESIIYAANKPKDTTWVDWFENYEGNYCFNESLLERKDALHVSCLVLMDHPNRTKNLHKILADTKLTVISSTGKALQRSSSDKKEIVPDASWLYGRPAVPDFGKLTDDVFDLYLRDGVSDLDSLIPVYDFSVRSLSYKQLVDEHMEKRTPLVLLSGQPLLRAESITELFAWRGTGKTLFSLALGLHLAAGKSMPGLEITSSRKVLYVEGELPKAQLQERLKQLGLGLSPDPNFQLIGKSQHGKGQTAVSIKTEAGRQAIEAHIEQNGSEVLILDSIASLAQINTNNEEDWLPIIEWMVELRCKGMCVVYLQQSGKSGEQRGHSVSEDRIDLAIRLTATNNNPEGAAFKMTFTKEREGSLTPLSLICTQGVWGLAPDKAVKQPKLTKKAELDKKISEALNSGESQQDIAARLKVSKTRVNRIKKEATNDTTNVQS